LTGFQGFILSSAHIELIVHCSEVNDTLEASPPPVLVSSLTSLVLVLVSVVDPIDAQTLIPQK